MSFNTKKNLYKRRVLSYRKHQNFLLFFCHSFAVHLDIITSLINQLNAQLDVSRNFETYIIIYIKMLLHVSV